MVSSLNIYYVYGHFRNDTKQLFYVGKGKLNRAFSKKNRNKHWHNIANKIGYFVQFYIENIDEHSAYELEKSLIIDLSPQCNYTCGGEGGNTFLKKTQKEIEEIVSKRKINPSKCASYGFKNKKHTEARNKALSEKFSGKMFHTHTKEHLDKLITAAKKKSIRIRDIETGIVYDSIRDASRKLGLSKSCIIYNLKNNRKFIKYNEKEI